MMSNRPNERLSIGGAFGFMAVIGTVMYLAEPDWKKREAPIVDIQENRMVLKERGNPQVAYVDLQPFGSLDYVLDSSSGIPAERSFGCNDSMTFSALYRTAVAQGSIKED